MTDRVTTAIRAGCEAADVHFRCSYPACVCAQMPAAVKAAISSFRAAPITDASEIEKKLRVAINTACSDDTSKPRTLMNTRHTARIEAMEEAIEYLAAERKSADGLRELLTELIGLDIDSIRKRDEISILSPSPLVDLIERVRRTLDSAPSARQAMEG